MNLSKGSQIVLSILFIIGLAAVIGYRMMYKPHTKTMDQQVAFTGTAQGFQKQVIHHQQKWQNAFIVLKGKVTGLDQQGLSLNQTIYCQLEDSLNISQVKVNASVAIKGRFIGYDDLLEEIKLDQCIIIKPKDEKN